MRKRRKCACGCGEHFTPTRSWHKYLNRAHQNDAAQKRMRKRARLYYEHEAAQQGAIGNG